MKETTEKTASLPGQVQPVVRCLSCPECGCADVADEFTDYLADGYRVCEGCGQEWYTDVDYPHHVNKTSNKELSTNNTLPGAGEKVEL